MRVAIVEDELHTRREIKRLLERYAAENSVSFHITEFADGDSITENYSGCYDLILMDVEMPLGGHDHFYYQRSSICHKGVQGRRTRLYFEAGELLRVLGVCKTRDHEDQGTAPGR